MRRVHRFLLLLNFSSFWKYLSCVLFPKVVISAFIGFVFLCQVLTCLVTGFNLSSIGFSVVILVFFVL